jgi:hypothetical protein
MKIRKKFLLYFKPPLPLTSNLLKSWESGNDVFAESVDKDPRQIDG